MILKETGHVIATARDIVGASGSGLFQKKKILLCVVFVTKERKKERERERKRDGKKRASMGSE